MLHFIVSPILFIFLSYRFMMKHSAQLDSSFPRNTLRFVDDGKRCIIVPSVDSSRQPPFIVANKSAARNRGNPRAFECFRFCIMKALLKQLDAIDAEGIP